MPPIAQVGTIVAVTPGDEIQICSGPGDYEFVEDETPFFLRVEEIIRENDRIIGVSGHVISGPERYQGLIATLFVRLDNSDWARDNRSAAQFKVAREAATLNGAHPFNHPDGSDVPYPFIVRYGSIYSRVAGEPEVKSAKEAPDRSA